MITGDQIRESLLKVDMQIFRHNSTRFVEIISGNAGSDRIELRMGKVQAAAVGPATPMAASAPSPRGRELAEVKRQAAIARRDAKENQVVASSPSVRRRG